MVSSRARKAIITIGIGIALFMTVSAESCTNTSSNDKQTEAADKAGNAATKKWGDVSITNFTEYKLYKEIYELRDRTDLVNYAYLQGNDGALRCLGQVVGYGVPYATQLTPPYTGHDNGSTDPVREPNGLFMPDSAEATWLRLIDPNDPSKTYIIYVEPRLVVSPVKLPCKPLDA